MGNELYSILEVSPDASAEEIRRAYYRMIRRFPPEKEPERFKVLRRAYDILSDPKARCNYDALQAYGDEIRDLWAKAIEYMEAQDFEKAISLLKRVILLAPGQDTARNYLGICYLQSGKIAEAQKVFEYLVKENPDIAVYHLNYGYTLFEECAELRKEAPSKAAALSVRARAEFKRAAELDSLNAQPYLAVADTYIQDQNFDEAINWAEKAINADGTADFQDFEALEKICMIYLYKNDLEGVERTAQRIYALAPEDEEIRAFVAFRFASVGYELYKAGRFDAACILTEVAKRFDSKREEIAELHRASKLLRDAYAESREFQDDSGIIRPLRGLGTFILLDTVGEKFEGTRDEIFARLIDELNGFSPQSVLSSIRRIRRHYPTIFQLGEKLFEKIEHIALDASQSRPLSATTNSGPSQSASNGCFVATATFGTPYAKEILVLRHFRDEHLRHTVYGRIFIRFYYRTGPYLAKLVSRYPKLRKVLAPCLGALAKMIAQRYNIFKMAGPVYRRIRSD